MGFKRSKLPLRQRPRLSLLEASPHPGVRTANGPRKLDRSHRNVARGAFTSRLVKVVAKSSVILLSYENPGFGGNRQVQFLSPSGTPSRTRYDY